MLAHIDDLRIFIDNSKIDILSVNETKLDSSIGNSDIHLSGYDVVRLDRKVNGRNGGGVCMYIRSNLNFRIREDLAYNDIEILIIEISNPRSRPFLVGTWYRAPSSSQQLFTLLEEIITPPAVGEAEFSIRPVSVFVKKFSVSEVGAALMGDTAGTSRVRRPKHGV